MLGKRPVPGRPTNLDYNSKAGAIALAVGAVGFFLDIFSLIYHFSIFIKIIFFLPLSGRRPDID